MRDIHWSISGTDYVIRNVPYEQIDNEEYLDINVSIKITALRDLMFENAIPKDVNYEHYDGIEL